MSSTVIKVENLSKQYRLGDVGTGTLSHDLKRWWYKARGKEDPYLQIGETNDRSIKGESDYVWALKDINFEVKAGEVLGIIGRNGAGKSTLLKILSKTTTPTTGSVKVKGRIASLLEVGTGFHPELTGRENIFLNGAILGMTKREIQLKFEEIVNFSGVERYIDTPVKRYSSGMYVRLAFAVAAHLEPEILIVDEVLAVGDAEFQKKCLGKMKDVSVNEGRTVLFVSHNMGAISKLCTEGIFMENGYANIKVPASTAVASYFNANSFKGETKFPIINDQLIIHDFRLTQDGEFLGEFDGSKKMDIEITFELLLDVDNFRIGFFIKTSTGELLNRSLLADWDQSYSTLIKGKYTLKGVVPPYLLVAGNYIFQVHSSRYGLRDYGTCELSSIPISILSPYEYNKNYMGENTFGNIIIKQEWHLHKF